MCGSRKYPHSCSYHKEGCWELREVSNANSFKRNIMIIIIVKSRFYNWFNNIPDFHVMVHILFPGIKWYRANLTLLTEILFFPVTQLSCVLPILTIMDPKPSMVMPHSSLKSITLLYITTSQCKHFNLQGLFLRRGVTLARGLTPAGRQVGVYKQNFTGRVTLQPRTI